MTTGAILKAFRERNNLSQETVASFLGIRREMLSYYENDSREAPLDVLEKLADLYGADLADFFETDNDQIQANIAFAFRADGIHESDFYQISQFRKVVKNYFKILELELTHD
ncbi:helix-turn-helix transcriptional regulator [Solitalea sp. MAHUQ-68]|uniref:Helix-turn-helix transcriptional regulator n=1 Tax=Solitalea agri TaxID=2953739 RepID=A0A9X2JAF3_9SPHI|nr:helix-turn-helix transcriptional regulator [Solitalea agri]MCO4291352.1 helix-turn-helix transcriptional regulator [Solitalea agri]